MHKCFLFTQHFNSFKSINQIEVKFIFYLNLRIYIGPTEQRKPTRLGATRNAAHCSLQSLNSEIRITMCIPQTRISHHEMHCIFDDNSNFVKFYVISQSNSKLYTGLR